MTPPTPSIRLVLQAPVTAQNTEMVRDVMDYITRKYPIMPKNSIVKVEQVTMLAVVMNTAKKPKKTKP